MTGEPARFFNRDGVEIDKETFVRLRQDIPYGVVGSTRITDSADVAKVFDVSTMWLGIEYAGEPARLFATMYTDDGQLYNESYASLRYARLGHAATVKSVAATLAVPIIVDNTPTSTTPEWLDR